MTDELAANRALVARFYLGFNAGTMEVYDEILSPDWTDHPSAPGQSPGPQGLKEVVAQFRAALDGLVITPQVVVAEGDHVVVRIRLEGRHVLGWMGYPASGRQVALDGMDMHRIKDGRIVSTWHFEHFQALA